LHDKETKSLEFITTIAPMSLNNISLSPQLLTDLYSNVIIESQPAQKPEKQPYKFLGSNKKNILLLVSKENVAFLEDEELNFLSTILTACKLSIADVAVINIKTIPVKTSYKSLTSQLKSKMVLLFNVDALTIDLPFNFPHFQLQQFDQITYLSAPALKEMEENKTTKTQLWNCLKNAFRL
jgi:DNA polymerase III psi subunit